MRITAVSRIIGLALAVWIAFPTPNLRAESNGVVDKDWIWKPELTRTGAMIDGMIILRACWDIDPLLNIPGGFSTFIWKNEVQKHIQEYWNGFAGIKFVFDGAPCDFTIGHGDLRYKPGSTEDWRPNAAIGRGAALKQKENEKAVILCWTFQNYAPGQIQKSTYSTSTGQYTGTYDPQRHRTAILAQATHEFGHILGLEHEQNNPDRPANCTEKLTNGNYTFITLYDEHSIMNYCNPNYPTNQYTPSCGDIATIRALYGLHPTERKSTGCILECASGLEDNLAKSGAGVSGCKMPSTQTIIGSLAGLTPQVDYPGQGTTPPPITIPEPHGTPSGVRAVLNVNITKRPDDKMTVNITPANGSEFHSRQVWVHHIDGYLPIEAVETGHYWLAFPADGADMDLFSNTQTVTWTPTTLVLPQADNGRAPLRTPSKLHFGWNYNKTKIAFSNYSSLYIRFDYYTCASQDCLVHGEQRVKIMDIPQSIDFFNKMNPATSIPRPKPVYIPPKYSNGSLEIPSFYMDRTEVTQREYIFVTKTFPFNYPGDADMPAEGMTMYDAVLYCNKRSILEGLAPVYTYTGTTFDADGNCTMLANLAADKSKNGYRLPTFAEWNYAYAANTTTAYFWGNTLSDGANYSWSQENSGDWPHNVAKKNPNPWGIYDMLGNVLEWTLDKNYGSDGIYYPDFQCALRGNFYQPLSTQAGSSQYSSCGSAGSKWSFIGFRPLRNAVNMAPIYNLLLQ